MEKKPMFSEYEYEYPFPEIKTWPPASTTTGGPTRSTQTDDISRSQAQQIANMLKKTSESSEEPKEGLRYNKGKIRYSVLSPAAMEAEALVTLFGGMKYDHSNFKKFKATEAEAKAEFVDCIFRHLMKIIKGEDMDSESLQMHAAHITWNANRLIDLHYYGMTHGNDGKDLYQQPYRTPMTPVPTEENFAEIWGMIPHSGGKKAPKKGTQ